jgi:DNA (cytosine-5)-methyltransferase 1
MAMSLSIGSCFSGIGGLEFGLERAGLGPVSWQVESDGFCRVVLAKHWPDAEGHWTIEAVQWDKLAPVDLMCGGFPCQDISAAGKRYGLTGKRSGLWYEMLKGIEAISPQWVVIENVQHTWRRWAPQVRWDLSQLGYWSVALRLSAADVGAWHRRRRVFVLAHANSHVLWELSRWWSGESREGAPQFGPERWPKPDIERAADGIPNRMDRCRALGNAVVPQCAEVIGHYIKAADQIVLDTK